MSQHTLHSNLRRLMYDREIRTFAEVSRRTGVTPAIIRNLYHNTSLHSIRIHTLQKVCNGLDCTLLELINTT